MRLKFETLLFYISKHSCFRDKQKFTNSPNKNENGKSSPLLFSRKFIATVHAMSNKATQELFFLCIVFSLRFLQKDIRVYTTHRAQHME